MKILNKISVKAVVGSIPTEDVKIPKLENGNVVTKNGETVFETVQRGIRQDVMRVFGQCDKLKLGNTQFGETVEFQGVFKATNILTGEVFQGSRLFLPPVLTDLLRAQVAGAGDTGVQFAFDIGIDSANTPHGYQYTITPLMEASKSDPLALMEAALLKDAPALPAPKKVEALEAPKTEAVESTETKTGGKAKK